MMDCSAAQAQQASGHYSYSLHFGQDEGLPQNSISFLASDSYGYVWIGTQGGIARFDGINLTGITPSSQFPMISARTLGAVWKKGPGMPDTLVVYSDKNDQVFIVNGNVQRIEVNEPEGLVMLNDFTQYFLRDTTGVPRRNGTIYGYSFPGDTIMFGINSLEGFGMNTYYPRKQAKATSVTVTDRHHILRHGKYIISLDPVNNTLSWYTPSAKAGSTRLALKRQCMLVGDEMNRTAWLYTDNTLYAIHIEQEKLWLEEVISSFNPGGKPTHILRLDNGILIAGTETNGLTVYYPGYFKTALPSSNNISCYAQVLLPDNVTVLSGCNRLYRKDMPVSILPLLGNVYSRSMLKDRDNYYWYVNYQTIRKPDFTEGVISKLFRSVYPGKDSQLVSYIDEVLEAMYQDSRGDIWASDSKCRMLRIRGNKITKIPLLNNQGIKLIDYLTEDKNGQLLAGTDNGLYRFTIYEDKLVARQLALKGTIVRYISTDSSGIWFSSYGAGFCLLNENTGQLTRFPVDRQHSINFVHSIINDRTGRVWLPTNNGLYVTTRQSLLDYIADSTRNVYYYRFETKDGLPINEFNGSCQPSFLYLPGGWVSMPTLKGITWMQPDSIRIYFPSGRMTGTQVWADGKNTEINNDSFLSIPPGISSLKIQVGYSYWGNLLNNQTEYCLIPGNSLPDPGNWQKLLPGLPVEFRYLKHGTYHFYTRVRTGFGAGEFSYSDITVYVKPQWYETVAFNIFIPVFIIALLWGYSTLLRFQKKRLQAKINAATLSLIGANEELEQNNKMNRKIIGMFNHDISLPLLYLNRSLQHLMETPAAPEPLRKELSNAYESSRSLHNLTETLLEWIKLQSQQGRFVIQHEETQALALFREQLALFSVKLQEKGIITETDCPESFSLVTDYRVLSIIINNLLSNAVKHVSKGMITLGAYRKEGRSVLFVRDTGTGFRYSQAGTGEGTERETAHGLGLSIVHDLAATLKCEVRIDSAEGKGTLASVIFTDPDHLPQE